MKKSHNEGKRSDEPPSHLKGQLSNRDRNERNGGESGRERNGGESGRGR